MNHFSKLCRYIADKLDQVADDDQQGICHFTEQEAQGVLLALQDVERGIVDRTNGNVKE